LHTLTHYDRDVFTWLPEGETAGSMSGVIFQTGPERKAASAVVEALNAHGQGTFIRVPAQK
jgi:hypothetical protein